VGAVIAIAIAIVWGFISKYLLLQVSHLPTTLLLLLLWFPCWSAVFAACHHYHCGKNKRKSTVLHIFISFCFGNDDGEFDSKGDSNNNGNGYGDDLSLSVL
jgi:hypothetical protein